MRFLEQSLGPPQDAVGNETSADLVNVTHHKHAEGKSFSRLAGTDGDYPLLASIRSESLQLSRKYGGGGIGLDDTQMTL